MSTNTTAAKAPHPPAADPTFSALQAFIAEQEHLHSRETGKGPRPPIEITRLALQIAHNLRFQHNWTDMRVHYRTSANTGAGGQTVPRRRPMISGLPPQRVYVHPDEQIDALEQQRRERGAGGGVGVGVGVPGMPEMGREREWVLPTHLRENWTLRRFGEVFDTLSAVPPEGGGGALFREEVGGRGQRVDGEEEEGADGDRDGQKEDEEVDGDSSAVGENPWRTSQPKRLLLATLDDDSTIVYYIVHDGIVKPRQN
ncbi:hypothetical protein LTR36_009541 [Oleoguttula mirabilis]|uniref:tRNA-splicing endonuclease subunit Sen15 domain-containing protein n=1 Tax=Oleoguttula mirabilis TaxID=1507867 RepID=A0AAV9JT87_9PEZI|nr:hypothetical protein LTR36_009541 [Oleoguttula mirabilis]